MEDALREINPFISELPQKSLNPCSNGRCSARGSTTAALLGWVVVLILVLMEDALRADTGEVFSNRFIIVLILVLMEDALRVCGRSCIFFHRSESLNPCSNGRCSASAFNRPVVGSTYESLNPCSNGRCSASTINGNVLPIEQLRLNPCSNGRCSARANFKTH